MLCVEHDCLEVFVSAGCIPQEVCTPLHAGGCGGDLSPPRGSGGGPIPPPAGGSGGQWSPGGGSGAVPPKLKTNVNLPCKIIVISSQSGPFIRWMI